MFLLNESFYHIILLICVLSTMIYAKDLSVSVIYSIRSGQCSAASRLSVILKNPVKFNLWLYFGV